VIGLEAMDCRQTNLGERDKCFGRKQRPGMADRSSRRSPRVRRLSWRLAEARRGPCYSDSLRTRVRPGSFVAAFVRS